MKIIKWVKGFDDSGKGNPRLLYPDLWASCENKPSEERERLMREAENAVIDCIRRNGFKFGGSYHQYGDFGMPMFEDGTVYLCSMRHWGSIMAEAWNVEDKRGYGYVMFAWEGDMSDDGGKVPKGETDFV